MIVTSLSIIPVFASNALIIRLADSTEVVCKLEKEPQMVFANKKITLSSTEGTIGQWDFDDVVLWKFDEVKEVDAIEEVKGARVEISGENITVSGEAKVAVYDINGREQHLRSDRVDNVTNFNLSRLPKGTYLLKIGKNTIKFLKK